MKKSKLAWYNFKYHLDKYFLVYVLIFAILAVIWAAVRPHPGTNTLW
jgi:hypothetical protein